MTATTTAPPQPFVLVDPGPKKRRMKPLPRATRDAQRRQERLNKPDHAAYEAAYAHPTADPDELRFRHEHWGPTRACVDATLEAIGTNPRQLDAFRNCGSQCVVCYCKATGRYKLSAACCHSRHCQPCARAKANLLAANLRNRLAEARDHQYRFVTLTLRHTNTPLAHQLKRLTQSFRDLRRTQLWKTTQHGGAAIIEVKWNPDDRMWHPHLHIVSEGDYLSQDQLSSAWHAITGDSKIVDVRALRSGKDAAHYVAKYVSKGTVDAVWSDPDAAQEWVLATKGLRSCATYGTWRGFKLLARLPDTHVWTRVCMLTTLYHDARQGLSYARITLRALHDQCQYNPHRNRGDHEGS